MKRTIALIVFLTAIQAGYGAEPKSGIDYNRDIRPILSNHCFGCHGLDDQSRKAGLRLDVREEAIKKLKSDSHAILPGRAEESELVARVEADDESQMPPASFTKPLTVSQKELLRRWIAEGAPYAGHWAFTPPVRVAKLPEVGRKSWPRNSIDYFVLEKIENNGLSPSPEADRSTWLRRVTLDLTGLPPTPEELKTFLSDQSPDAYEKLVDRLFESPGHGERLAMQWLDLARYADTNGYNNDETRTLWPWRDWVISAFARNMPYDRFITEQLAGDLLPDATVAQKVATGFVRNHVLTTEGGIIEAEYQAEYVADRVHTTATVFMGVSLQCARCHNHKYDPFTQRDYYRFAAFFNNIPDKIVPYSKGRMAEPLLQVPSAEQLARKTELENREKLLKQRLQARPGEIAAEMKRWEESLTPDDYEKITSAGLASHFPLDEMTGPEINDLVSQKGKARLEGKFHSDEGRIGNAIVFDGMTFINAGETGNFEADQPFSSSAWIYPASQAAGTVLSKIDDGNAFRGYDMILEQGRLAAHFVNHWPDRAFKVITKKPMALNQWHHVLVSYDGSQAASGARIYVDGQLQEIEATTNNRLEGSIRTERPFHIGKRSASAAFHGRIDDVRLFTGVVNSETVAALAKGESLNDLKAILKIAADKRQPMEQERLEKYYLTNVDSVARDLQKQLAEIPRQLEELNKSIPVTMVMGEMTPRRPTHILKRGQYDQLGEMVEPGLLSTFDGLPSDGRTRLDMARWLTNPGHPLTARVTVNRYWEMLFGTGLVETAEDFGVQGALPSHAELLDWLAVDFVESGWNLRKLLRQIVLSATYRQSSKITPGLHEADPRNRLLARGPRYRLPAEMVRDNALAISGLLVGKVGGPSVKPYQPEGLWEDVSVERREKYTPDFGEGLYRRSMYTFWKRTCPPPGMASFDAPDRETCTIRRARTNTPLQSLVLLNDPTYVEAARKFAERLLAKTGSDTERVRMAYQLAVGRGPTEKEIGIIQNILESSSERFRRDEEAATWLLSIGYSKPAAGMDRVRLAAWSTVTSVILNLDETITKP